jgi:hypothetical protein
VVYVNSPMSVVVVVLPASFPPWFSTTVYQEGAGQVAFIPANGASLQSLNGHRGTSGQYARGVLSVRANPDGISADRRLYGDLAAVSLSDRASLGAGGQGLLLASVGQRQQISAGFGGSAGMGPRAAQRQSAKPQTWSGASTVSAIGQSPH